MSAYSELRQNGKPVCFFISILHSLLSDNFETYLSDKLIMNKFCDWFKKADGDEDIDETIARKLKEFCNRDKVKSEVPLDLSLDLLLGLLDEDDLKEVNRMCLSLSESTELAERFLAIMSNKLNSSNPSHNIRDLLSRYNTFVLDNLRSFVNELEETERSREFANILSGNIDLSNEDESFFNEFIRDESKNKDLVRRCNKFLKENPFNLKNKLTVFFDTNLDGITKELNRLFKVSCPTRSKQPNITDISSWTFPDWNDSGGGHSYQFISPFLRYLGIDVRSFLVMKCDKRANYKEYLEEELSKLRSVNDVDVITVTFLDTHYNVHDPKKQNLFDLPNHLDINNDDFELSSMILVSHNNIVDRHAISSLVLEKKQIILNSYLEGEKFKDQGCHILKYDWKKWKKDDVYFHRLQPGGVCDVQPESASRNIIETIYKNPNVASSYFGYHRDYFDNTFIYVKKKVRYNLNETMNNDAMDIDSSKSCREDREDISMASYGESYKESVNNNNDTADMEVDSVWISYQEIVKKLTDLNVLDNKSLDKFCSNVLIDTYRDMCKEKNIIPKKHYEDHINAMINYYKLRLKYISYLNLDENEMDIDLNNAIVKLTDLRSSRSARNSAKKSGKKS